jgi:L-ribulokinase
MPDTRFAIGCDFGTESVRVVLVGVDDGTLAATAAVNYQHGVIDRALPHSLQPLPPDYALQHPQDWLDALAAAVRAALAAGGVNARQVVGVGVAFTSCTMLPCLANGTPLCLTESLAATPLAWPRLWKHHGATAQAERITEIARSRNEKWLARYGGVVGVEWLFPKILETLEHAPQVYDAAQVWLEAGDWLVWQLTTGPFPACATDALVRSTCQAGYKALWNATDGFPSPDFFAAVHPQLRDVVASRMPGRLAAPGARAGCLTPAAAALLGLAPHTPVSAAIIDAHAGVPGAGAALPGTLVMVLGTSSCHMLNSPAEHLIPGIAGVVRDGILPGLFGYETGQASVGDALAWVARTTNLSHAQLNDAAALLRPGSGGVLALDWLNGCRTPLMDSRLSGALLGLTLATRPEQLYRAMIEATAMGVRWIRDALIEGGVPVTRYVASGGLGQKSPLLLDIYASVLAQPIERCAVDQPVALGAAILARLAAHGTLDAAAVSSAIHAMAPRDATHVFTPTPAHVADYDRLYQLYRQIAQPSGAAAHTMRSLRQFHH